MKKIINKNIKRNLLNEFIYLGIIPGALIIFWITASILFNSRISSSVLVYPQKDAKINTPSEGLLFKGNKITGEFKAQDNYLYNMQFKFDKFAKHDFTGDDVLAFRIRPSGTESWNYSNTYRTSALENDLIFPFEFPVIKASKDKTYQFEIESLLGNNTNGVETRKNTSELYTGYEYPISEITKNNSTKIEFILKKIITSSTNSDFFLRSLLYLIPFLGYTVIFIYKISLDRKFSDIRYIITIITITLLYLDVFQIKQTYMGVFLILIMGWMLLVSANRLGSKSSFISAFSLIILWTMLPLFKINDYQNKFNLWTYTFLAIGLFHAVLEEKKLQLLTRK